MPLGAILLGYKTESVTSASDGGDTSRGGHDLCLTTRSASRPLSFVRHICGTTHSTCSITWVSASLERLGCTGCIKRSAGNSTCSPCSGCYWLGLARRADGPTQRGSSPCREMSAVAPRRMPGITPQQTAHEADHYRWVICIAHVMSHMYPLLERRPNRLLFLHYRRGRIVATWLPHDGYGVRHQLQVHRRESKSTQEQQRRISNATPNPFHHPLLETAEQALLPLGRQNGYGDTGTQGHRDTTQQSRTDSHRFRRHRDAHNINRVQRSHCVLIWELHICRMLNIGARAYD